MTGVKEKEGASVFFCVGRLPGLDAGICQKLEYILTIDIQVVSSTEKSCVIAFAIGFRFSRLTLRDTLRLTGIGYSGISM